MILMIMTIMMSIISSSISISVIIKNYLKKKKKTLLHISLFIIEKLLLENQSNVV